jgi:hypothetical protein
MVARGHKNTVYGNANAPLVLSISDAFCMLAKHIQGEFFERGLVFFQNVIHA